MLAKAGFSLEEGASCRLTQLVARIHFLEAVAGVLTGGCLDARRGERTLGVERVLPGCGHTTRCSHRREYILPVRNNLLIHSHPGEENFWRGLASNLEDRDSGGYLTVPHFEAIRRKGIYCECLCIRFCGHVFLFLQYKHSRIGMLENVVKK